MTDDFWHHCSCIRFGRLPTGPGATDGLAHPLWTRNTGTRSLTGLVKLSCRLSFTLLPGVHLLPPRRPTSVALRVSECCSPIRPPAPRGDLDNPSKANSAIKTRYKCSFKPRQR